MVSILQQMYMDDCTFKSRLTIMGSALKCIYYGSLCSVIILGGTIIPKRYGHRVQTHNIHAYIGADI